ncbi:hypothetical protein [Geodermatophilus sp. URMC 63]
MTFPVDACTCSSSALDAGWPRPRNCQGLPTLYIQNDPHNFVGNFNGDRRRECVRLRKCQICGAVLDDRPFGLPSGGRCNAAAGFNQDTLLHERCLGLALRHCPKLEEWRQGDHLTVLREPAGVQYTFTDTVFDTVIDHWSVKWEVVHRQRSRATAPSDAGAPSIGSLLGRTVQPPSSAPVNLAPRFAKTEPSLPSGLLRRLWHRTTRRR